MENFFTIKPLEFYGNRTATLINYSATGIMIGNTETGNGVLVIYYNKDNIDDALMLIDRAKKEIESKILISNIKSEKGEK